MGLLRCMLSGLVCGGRYNLGGFKGRDFEAWGGNLELIIFYYNRGILERKKNMWILCVFIFNLINYRNFSYPKYKLEIY